MNAADVLRRMITALDRANIEYSGWKVDFVLRKSRPFNASFGLSVKRSSVVAIE